jgi:hypothetical protein
MYDAVVMESGTKIHIQSFVKIGSGIEKLLKGIDTQTAR